MPTLGFSERTGVAPERPQWMVHLAILLILGVPAIVQILMHTLDQKNLYYWGCAMFTS
jgi:hypothetical protein